MGRHLQYAWWVVGGNAKCQHLIKLSGSSTTATGLHFANCHPELHHVIKNLKVIIFTAACTMCQAASPHTSLSETRERHFAVYPVYTTYNVHGDWFDTVKPFDWICFCITAAETEMQVVFLPLKRSFWSWVFLKIMGSADPLEWWKVNESKFHSLACMARHCLTVPASSESVERLFSSVGLVKSDLRALRNFSTRQL